MAETSRPFAGTTRAVVSEAQQRAYYAHLGDGIINAKNRAAGDLIADGTSVLRYQPVEAKVRGLYYQNDAEKLFNLAAIGAQPAAGQSRLDFLVHRLDMPGKTITAEVVAGVPAANPTVPALARDLVGLYEPDVWSWRWTGQGLTQPQLVDRRTYLGPHLLVPSSTMLRDDADFGSTARAGGVSWSFEDVGGTFEWVDVGKATRDILAADPAKLEQQFEAVRVSSDVSFPRAGMDFLTRVITIPPRPYRRSLNARAATLIQARDFENTYLDIWFKLFRRDVVNGRAVETLVFGDGAERVRAAQIGVSTPALDQDFTLDADMTYTLQFLGDTAGTGRVFLTSDPRFTRCHATTRGIA